MTITNAISIGSPQPTATALTPTGSSSSGLSFGDILDAVNPLQHIPVVSSVYRTLTGGTISATSQIAGDAIYGLALGGGTLVSAAIGAAPSVAENVTGVDVAKAAVNAVTGNSSSSLTGAKETALVPNADADLSSAPVSSAPTTQTAALFPFDKNPATTAAQYHKAQILGHVNNLLLHM
ncbi:MAG TPA: hypothetical protein VFT64_09360 [Rickettsiales bacterium]|nr:hypothetical protein [Rickettsiales bacterium]